MMTKEVTDPYSPQLLVWSCDHDDDDGDDDDDDDQGYSPQLLVWSHLPTHPPRPQVYRNAEQVTLHERQGDDSGK